MSVMEAVDVNIQNPQTRAYIDDAGNNPLGSGNVKNRSLLKRVLH